MVGLRIFGQSRHTHHAASYGYEHLGTIVDDDVVDFHREAIGGTVGFSVGREAVLRLGNANRIAADAQLLDQLQLVLGLLAVENLAGTIDFLRYSSNLVFHAVIILIEQLQRARRLLLHGTDDHAGQCCGTFSALGIGVVDRKHHVEVLLAVTAHSLHLLVGIVGIAVEGHDNGLSEATQVLDMLVEIPHSLLHGVNVTLIDLLIVGTTVHLQCFERHHENGEIRL